MGYSRRTWSCPYYKWDERGKVHCEGGCVSLGDRAAYQAYAARYCGSPSGWRGCTLARALTERYEGAGEAGGNR